MSNITELLNNIYFGYYYDKIQDIEQYHFSHIISMKDLEMSAGILNYSMKIPELDNIKLSSHYARLFSFLNKAKRIKDYKVYFCSGDASLAAVFASAYLMHEFGYTDSFCLTLIRQNCPSISIPPSYVKQLKLYYSSLAGSKRYVKYYFYEKYLDRFRNVLDSDNIKDIIETSRGDDFNRREAMDSTAKGSRYDTSHFKFSNMDDESLARINLLQFSQTLPKLPTDPKKMNKRPSESTKSNVTQTQLMSNTLLTEKGLKSKYAATGATANLTQTDAFHGTKLSFNTELKKKKQTDKEPKFSLDIDKVENNLNGQNVKNLSYSMRNKDIVNEHLVYDGVQKTFINMNALNKIVEKTKRLNHSFM